MENLNFKSNVKKYSLNGDENCVISVNTTDYAIIDRIKKATKNIEKLAAEYQEKKINNDDEANELFVETDKEIRNQINYIFNSDVCTMAFGNTNCFSLCDDGSALFENFISAIIPVIRADIEAAQEKQSKRIEKYTSQAKKFK